MESLINVRYQVGLGWRTQKRPGVDYFLATASQYAEIIVFSSKLNGGVGWTLMPRVDPNGFVSFKFFEEYDKDILALNRPLDKLILITSYPEEYYKFAWVENE